MMTIRRQLLAGLLLSALACIMAASLALYSKVREEAGELADLQLRQTAATLPAVLSPTTVLAAAGDPEEAVTIAVWDPAGTLGYQSRGVAPMPRVGAPGFSAGEAGGQAWRIYAARHGERWVQVAQPIAVRDRLAAKLALRIALPLLAFIPIFGVLVYLVVGRALRPLEQVAQAVGRRSPQALHPLALDVVSPELQAIVDALNDLLGKIAIVITHQRQFVADAAHELRSPLTALKLQLQLAERADGDGARAIAFSKLHERLDRASHLVQQMLSLARHEPDPVAAPAGRVDLCQLARSVVADHIDAADERQIDLGMLDAAQPVAVTGDSDGLAVLLGNLVDNALRYTPCGGRVDVYVGVARGRAVLRVSDNGPGIAHNERERVFDRFYRPDGTPVWGSGLGLAIVKSVAEVHHAAVTLADGEEGCGLVVTVTFSDALDRVGLRLGTRDRGLMA